MVSISYDESSTPNFLVSSWHLFRIPCFLLYTTYLNLLIYAGGFSLFDLPYTPIPLILLHSFFPPCLNRFESLDITHYSFPPQSTAGMAKTTSQPFITATHSRQRFVLEMQ